jgi:hypothetical protein
MGQGSDKEFFLNFGLKISPYWEINADRFKGKSSRDGEARHHTQLQDGKIFGLARCSRGECSRTLEFSLGISFLKKIYQRLSLWFYVALSQRDQVSIIRYIVHF